MKTIVVPDVPEGAEVLPDPLTEMDLADDTLSNIHVHADDKVLSNDDYSTPDQLQPLPEPDQQPEQEQPTESSTIIENVDAIECYVLL